MITFRLQPDYLKWNLLTFSIDHLQSHILYDNFSITQFMLTTIAIKFDSFYI